MGLVRGGDRRRRRATAVGGEGVQGGGYEERYERCEGMKGGGTRGGS